MAIFTKYYLRGFHPIGRIKHFFSDISCAIQRARKGYCYRDLWNIDLWLFELLPNMIKDFKNNMSGYPYNYESMKDWQAELDFFISILEQYNNNDFSTYTQDELYQIIMKWLKNNLLNLWD